MGNIKRGWEWQPNYNRLAVKVGGEAVAYFNRNMGYIPPGNSYYVDTRSWGTALDTNSGLTPDEPLATINAAVAKCTTGKHDYIFVIDGYDNDTATITVAKTGLHIIGLDGFNHRAPFVWMKIAGTGALPCFTLRGGDAANVEIAGFTLGASASAPCITTTSGTSTNLVYGHIHHCAFAATGDTAFVAQDGINVASGTGLDGTLIEDCTFGYELTRDGIRFINFYDGIIRNCLFEMSAYMGVRQLTGGAARGMCDVIDNKFKQKIPALDAGSAIYITDAGGGLIDGNVAAENADGTCDNNPYFDGSSGTADTTLNAWGVNWKGYAVSVPAVT